MNNAEEYISISVAAKMLGIKERRVISFVRRRKTIKYFKQSKRITKILRSDIERYVVNGMLFKMRESIRI